MSVIAARETTGAGLTVATSFREFRDAVSRAFVPLEVRGGATTNFSASLRSVGFGEMMVTELQANRHAVARTPELIAETGTAYVKASLQLAGNGLLVQSGREVLLRPGSMALYSTDSPYTLTFDEDVRAMVFMFPIAALRLPAGLVAEVRGRLISGSTALGRTAFSFLMDLPRRGREANGLVRPRLARAAIDIIGALATADVCWDGDQESPRGRLLTGIDHYIEMNLHDANLGPRQIADAHFISTRHLHTLFQEQGTSVAGWIRQRRLDRCCEDLLDPVNSAVPVGMIAARAGFADPSHFSRLFRATYGCTASEMRARAAGTTDAVQIQLEELRSATGTA